MDMLLDDIIDGVVHQIQDNVAPRVETVKRHATNHLSQGGRNLSSFAQSLVSSTTARLGRERPSSNIDISYITERLLISSKPAPSPHPTFLDLGRDEPSVSLQGWGNTSTQQQQESVENPNFALHKGDSSKPKDSSDDVSSAAAAKDGGADKHPLEWEGPSLEESGKSLSDLPENPYSSDSLDKCTTASSESLIGREPECSKEAAGRSSLTGSSQNASNGYGRPEVGEGLSEEKCRYLGSGNESSSTIPDQFGTSVLSVENVAADDSTMDLRAFGNPSSELRVDAGEKLQQASGEDTKLADGIIPEHARSNPSSETFIITTQNPDVEGENVDCAAETGQRDSVEDTHVRLTSECDTIEKVAGRIESRSDDTGRSVTDLAEKAVMGEHSTNTGGLSSSTTSPSSSKVDIKPREPDVTLQASSTYKSKRENTIPATRMRNSAGNLVTYLDRRHGKHHYLAFSLQNEKPDDRTLLLFRRQIVQLGWSAPCLDRSTLPCIPGVLEGCYAIHAYLTLDSKNVALLYCDNGRSRTGIVCACYLKFSGMVEKAEEGFLYFLTKSTKSTLATDIFQRAPPSLRRFFNQFDEVVDRGCYLNCKPLFLKAIALQGLPVEEEPCIDIWDCNQERVFSSHPEMRKRDTPLLPADKGRQTSKWLDEDGFYQVNAVLDGDFLLLCRFGGDFAEENSEHDPTKILFRYTNTTGCISGGRPYELRFDHVDVTQQYINYLENDFLVTLLFQADWEATNELAPSASEILKARSKICGEQIEGRDDQNAIDRGLATIIERHAAQPSQLDVRTFHCFRGNNHDGEDSLCKYVRLAIQLSNFDYILTNDMLKLLRSMSSCRERVDGCISDVCSDDLKEEKRRMDEADTDEILGVLDCIDSRATMAMQDWDFTNDSGEGEDIVDKFGKRTIPSWSPSPVCRDKKRTDWLMPQISMPRSGEIFGSFSQQFSDMKLLGSDTEINKARDDSKGPRIPYTRKHVSKPTREFTTLIDDTDKIHLAKGAIELLPHTGILQREMDDLRCESQRWTNRPKCSTPVSESFQMQSILDKEIESEAGQTRNSSLNRQAKEKKEKQWLDHQKQELQAKGNADSKEPVAAEIKPLREELEYQKYFKMLKIGMPKEQVIHAMRRDEKDPAILDLDPDKPLKVQVLPSIISHQEEDRPLGEEPDYAKYFKMLKMGMPIEQVEHAMKRDEKDPAILKLDPSRSLSSQAIPENRGGEDPPIKEDPEFAKYFKMLSMKLPMGAVKNALLRDGKDPSIMDLDHNQSLKSQKLPPCDEDESPALKDDPEYAKYFKMLAMKLPIGAVKNALARDGKDPSILDLDPNKSAALQLGSAQENLDTGIPLKDDAEFSKYFKMQKMGLPLDAVKNALIRDGKDPTIIDLDPTKSIAYQKKQKKAVVTVAVKKKKRIRRKKIYWNPIDPGKIKEDSMWNIVRDYVDMDKLNYDQREFEELFTESADSKNQHQKKPKKDETKKLVQVIDPKRSMNGGIVLARLRTDHKKIADYVDKMEHGKFDSTQLKALKEYLPDADERRGLVAYMKKGDQSDEIKQRLFADLSETEKYMVTLMDVPEASSKLEALLFRSNFTSRFQDVTEAVSTLNAACDELRSSERLRKLMAMILTVVNQINTGGEGTAALGFTLDALLKLNEAKAFDRKTSVLHYVVKLVKKNDVSLISFDSDLAHVIPAESVILDGVSNDVKSIGQELDGVLDIVSREAQRLEEAGELRKMSLAELVEQKTMIHHVGIVPQFNKISHLTGRTSMERFTLNAKMACEQASELLESVQKKYAMVLGYFGEDENMATADFFGILRRFMAEWKKAVEQVNKIEKSMAKEKKRAEAKQAKANAKMNAKKSTTSKKYIVQKDKAVTIAKPTISSNGQDSQRIDISEIGHRPTVGIAALAAEAALKREKTMRMSDHQIPKQAHPAPFNPPSSGSHSRPANDTFAGNSVKDDVIASYETEEEWKDSGGISDFLGWANLAIQSSDTESVRGFEHSQSLEYNHDFDDESTIASAYYDDNASICSENVALRQVDISYFDDYGYQDTSYQTEKKNEAISPAKVAASILFSDSDTESPSVDHDNNGDMQTHQDVGMDTPSSNFVIEGLSFEADVGFDDGLGFGERGGEDVGFGSFTSPEPHTPETEEEKVDEKKPIPASKWFGGWGR